MSIWDNKELKKLLHTENYLSLGEGNTPIDAIKDNSNTILVKREDLNPTGSWKDRGSAFKLSKLIHDGVEECVIASSGNAAISLLAYANLTTNFKVNIVISDTIDRDKLELIKKLNEDQRHEIIISKTAKKEAIKVAVNKSIPLIKSGIDLDLPIGYYSLGFELYKHFKDYKFQNKVIIAQASSGTGFEGTIKGLSLKLNLEDTMPKLVLCQTSSCHPIVSAFNKEEYVAGEKSLAEAIVDQSALRSQSLIKALDETNGIALNISNSELLQAEEFSKGQKLTPLSKTSLLSIAGYLRIRDDYKDSVFICIASGR